MEDLYYSEYIELDKILNSQHPKSFDSMGTGNDELLFIIIHQAYELWFKQILHEVESVAGILEQPAINDNSPELQTIVHRLQRVNTIMKVLVQQMDIMETMTPMDFLDFRDMLRPASGFQSWQFKELEARLGLKFEDRHDKEYYLSQLRKEHVDIIKKAESNKSLLELVNAWLERMPLAPQVSKDKNSFWQIYRKSYAESLADAEKENLKAFDDIFLNEKQEAINDKQALSSSASRAALRSPLLIASSTVRTAPRIWVRRDLLTMVRRAILRVAFLAEEVLAISQLSFGCRRSGGRA